VRATGSDGLDLAQVAHLHWRVTGADYIVAQLATDPGPLASLVITPGPDSAILLQCQAVRATRSELLYPSEPSAPLPSPSSTRGTLLRPALASFVWRVSVTVFLPNPSRLGSQSLPSCYVPAVGVSVFGTSSGSRQWVERRGRRKSAWYTVATVTIAGMMRRSGAFCWLKVIPRPNSLRYVVGEVVGV